MATKTEIMAELKKLADPQTRKTHARHGAQEPFFGVKVGNLKLIQKRIKHDHKLALQLFETGNADAQYLASYLCEPAKLSAEELQAWAQSANWHMIREYSVAWAASESPHGWKLANQWIKSDDPQLTSTGWATLSAIVTVRPDDQLDLPAIKKLMKSIPQAIKKATERVAYTMNNFLICVGCCVEPLSDEAVQVAEKMGPVQIDLGDNACKVPYAVDYITKVIAAGRLGNKKKSAYC